MIVYEVNKQYLFINRANAIAKAKEMALINVLKWNKHDKVIDIYFTLKRTEKNNYTVRCFVTLDKDGKHSIEDDFIKIIKRETLD